MELKLLEQDFKSLDLAEDRGSFSNVIKRNNIPYPKFGVIKMQKKHYVIKELGFPLLVRPLMY
jgi:carbamoyl-phosphate synthase large subunit